MNNYGRVLLLMHGAIHEDHWRRADEWRRLNQRADVPPLRAVEKVPRVPLAAIGRLIPHPTQTAARLRLR